MGFEGRVALVTGASSGIGAGICESLVKFGMVVIGVARRSDKIEELGKKLGNEKGKLVAKKCDVTNDDEVSSLFEFIKSNYEGVDVLVNNAATISYEALLDDTPKTWRNLMDLNVVAPCLFAKLAVASMVERGIDDGYIIFIGSDSGHFVDDIDSLHFYDATKFALRALSQGLRMEMKNRKRGIRVSMLSPGFVDTEIFHQLGQEDKLAQMAERATKMLPSDMGRIIVHMITSHPRVEINDILVTATNNG